MKVPKGMESFEAHSASKLPIPLGSFLTPVQSRHQIRLGAAQSELLRQLAAVGTAARKIDCLIKALCRAAKFDRFNAFGNAGAFTFDAIHAPSGSQADRGRDFELAAHRGQT